MSWATRVPFAYPRPAAGVLSPPGAHCDSGSGELGEEVVALVVDDDEGGEVYHFDAPDRLHAELGIFDDFDLLDAVLGEPRRRPADRPEIEPAMLLAGFAHLGAAIA